MRPSLCQRWQVIFWPWWGQVHAQGEKARNTAACEGWALNLMLHRRAWASPPAVCLVSFKASPPTAMMKSQAAVVRQQPDRQPNSPGRHQNGCRPHGLAAVLCCLWWETTELRHEGRGSIKGHQIFICHTAPSPRLYPHSTAQQTTEKTPPEKQQQHREEPAETEETALIIFDLAPGSTDLFIDEYQEQFINHLIHPLQAGLFDFLQCFAWQIRQFYRGRSLLSHLPPLCSAKNKLMASQTLMEERWHHQTDNMAQYAELTPNCQ